MLKSSILSAAILAAAVPHVAFAQDTDAPTGATSFQEDGKQVYLPAYFERFGPKTALDMLNNVPGFVVRQADQQRGLGQGGTNVLINGSRVSGKTNDPLDVLGRTSRSSVERIEIVEGASLGISGLSGQVANVIVKKGETTGNWEYNPQFRKGLASRITNGSVSVSGTFKDVEYTLGVENNAQRNGAWGPEYVTNANDELIELRDDQVEPSFEEPSVSLELAHTDAAGREANFRANYTIFDFEFGGYSLRTPINSDDPVYERVIRETEEEWNTEISGDYAFDAFGGRLKLIGYQYYEHSPFTNAVTDTTLGGEHLFGIRSTTTSDEGESILRAEQTWSFGNDRSFELAGEGVYNFLDNEAQIFEIDENDVETEIEFPGATSKIEERRGEVSGTYNFPLGEKLDLQASLAVEYSEIEQSGDSVNKRSFTRPKGFVSATYELSPTVELRAQVDRRVGQLNFFAFASSVDLDDDLSNIGNTELVPQQSWFYQAAIEKTFADNSQMTLTIDFEQIEDIVQQIPIGDGEGPGNVPEAESLRIEFIGTQILDKFGIKGGELEWDITYRDSEIIDPFSLEERRLNGETKIYYKVEYRHDIPDTNWAYGGMFEEFENAPNYRGTEFGLYDQSRPTVELFIEHKDFFGANAQLYVFNILNYTEDFTRTLYDGLRPAPYIGQVTNEYSFNPIVGINFSGTF